MAQSCRYDQNTLGWVICSPVDHKLHSLSLSPFIHSCYMPAFESMTLVCHLVCSPQVYTSCLISVQPLSRVQPIATPWTAVCQDLVRPCDGREERIKSCGNYLVRRSISEYSLLAPGKVCNLAGLSPQGAFSLHGNSQVPSAYTCRVPSRPVFKV